MDPINRLKELDGEIYRLKHIIALLSWDQETYMPTDALDERSEQLAMMEGLLHKKVTHPEFEELFAKLGADDKNPGAGLAYPDAGFVRLIYRRYRRETCLPSKLVTELARETSLAQGLWVEAKNHADFSLFMPAFKKLIKLSIEKAEAIGYKENRYDALLDEFEPLMSTARLEKLFIPLKNYLPELVRRLEASGTSIETSFLRRKYDFKQQEKFSLYILKKMGYNFSRGRLDRAEHPFTTTLGYSDVRITTKYDGNFISPALFSSIHEGGHALYEHGFHQDIRNTTAADGTSLGIHESQSRIWEHLVGHGRPFWKAFYPDLKEHFPGILDDISLEEFYRGLNKVESSMIRVDADEVTYNLHVLLRYNLERRLIDETLAVEDLPEAWNHEMKELLGITPSNDAEGVLQDVHWASGVFGYFPTYIIGNLYSAQFYKTIKNEIPDMEAQLEQQNLHPILLWLRDKIHTHGSLYTAREICEKATGEPLNSRYFINYLEEKYKEIYGI